MFGLIATQSSTPVIGWCAKLLGWIMSAIYNIMDQLFNIQNIGLSIILFTVVIYLFMFPLTYKQQKFSKMSAKINPELDIIRKKYAGKKDQASMMAMSEEQKAVYEKYGVSASGSCIQLLIQMPILFALYRVIYNVPAYIMQVKEIFLPLVDKILATEGATEIMMAMGKEVGISQKLDYTAANTIVDVLNKFQTSHWAELKESFPQLSGLIASTQAEVDHVNNFLGLNIANSPATLLKTGSIIIIIAAIMIPVLAAATQWLNVKLMPQPSSVDQNGKEEDNAMANSMKQMNAIMPLMSAFFCFTLPSGMGIYWIMSALVRAVQQLFLNRHFDKIDMDEIIKKNLEKVNEKRAKQGLPPQKINEAAQRRAAQASKALDPEKEAEKKRARDEAVKRSTEYYNQNAKPGSIASKANMVRQFDEKNTRK